MMETQTMWGIYTRTGCLCNWTIAQLRRSSISIMVAERRLPWNHLKSLGYRCVRVTVTPAPDDAGKEGEG